MTTDRPVVVAEASDELEARIWVDALRDAGIAASCFERGVGAALGGAVTPGWARYPVLVPRDALAAARSVIADLGGAGALSPVEDPAASPGRWRAPLVVAGVALTGLAIVLLARAAAG